MNYPNGRCWAHGITLTFEFSAIAPVRAIDLPHLGEYSPWKVILCTTLRDKAKDFKSQDEYLDFRIVDIGAP